MMIRELCEGERPREKMEALGAFSLSNGELLAILLRTGLRGESVVELAQCLLGLAGGKLSRLFAMSLEELKAVPGIGSDKACSIQAACELGRRFMFEQEVAKKQPVTTARMVYELMLPRLKGLDHEEFWAAYFNSAWYYIGCERITTGSGKTTAFDVRRVVKGALDHRAYAVAIVHNHPSGNPRPSRADLSGTVRLREACERFELSLLDHIIVSDTSFYSFHEEQLYSR